MGCFPAHGYARIDTNACVMGIGNHERAYTDGMGGMLSRTRICTNWHECLCDGYWEPRNTRNARKGVHGWNGYRWDDFKNTNIHRLARMLM